MRIFCIATLVLAVAGALASPTFAEDDSTDFVCWDYDNGDLECVEYDEFKVMCEGIEDWGVCNDVLGLQGSPNYTSSRRTGQVPAVTEFVRPHVGLPRSVARIAGPAVRPTSPKRR